MDLAGLFRNQPFAADARSYAAAKYALELDGVAAGWIHSFEGGNVRGVVSEIPLASNPLVKKHLGNVRYEPVTIVCGTGNKGVLDWIRSFLSGEFQRKNGALVFADQNYKIVERLEFQDALITEVGIPAMDGAAAKEPFRLTVKFAPEFTRLLAGSGKQVNQPADTKQATLSSNFRLRIKGLEDDCKYTQRVEPLTIRRKTPTESYGEVRVAQIEPGKIGYSNLVFTVPGAHAGSIMKWQEDFVIRGNNGDAQERPGVLELLSPNLLAVLFTLNFGNLGIITAAPLPAATGADAVRKVKVEMYFERMDIGEGPGGTAATQGATTPPPPVKGIPPPPARSAPPVGAPGMLAPSPLQRQPLK